MRYEIMYTETGHIVYARTQHAAIRDIADMFQVHTSEVGLDDRSSSCGTDMQWHAWIAGRGDRQEPVAIVSIDDSQALGGG